MQIVFIHGSGASGSVWKYQSEYFPGSIAVTLPGRSDAGGEHPGSVAAMAAWLKSFIDEQGLEHLVLVGHSIGGGIALQYALDYPEDVQALVLLGSGGRLRVHPDTLSFMKSAIDDPTPFARFVAPIWKKVSEDFAAELEAEALALGPAVFLNDFRACDAFDIMDRLVEIRAPTLAVVGTEDIMTPPKYSEFMAVNMPDARVEIIEGGTHYLFVEQPAAVNAAIDEFLATLN